jgi:hypothetical protein
MPEGTTSKVTAADRPFGEFYDFYSVSSENFGSTRVCICGFTVIFVHIFYNLIQDTAGKILKHKLQVISVLYSCAITSYRWS